MKNPLLITTLDGNHVEIGDPFILRFNGRYYLYPSTCDEVEGVRCFVSDDLVNFTCYGLVAESPILAYAYAPEVIYHNGEFIMCTSPRGRGHYFLKSKSPLGPFTFITDNLANMIDGSFILDKENRLHFLRADHNGISYLDFVDNKKVYMIDPIKSKEGYDHLLLDLNEYELSFINMFNSINSLKKYDEIVDEINKLIEFMNSIGYNLTAIIFDDRVEAYKYCLEMEKEYSFDIEFKKVLLEYDKNLVDVK